MLNVKYQINFDPTKDEFKIDDITNILNPVERIFYIDSISILNNNTDIINKMTQSNFNPEIVSYVTEEINEFNKPTQHSNISIKYWSPNKIIIKSESANKHFVGLSEIFYPNWKITSHNIDIIELNGLIRGFISPKGKHEIVMEFDYTDIKTANMISLFSFIILVILFFVRIEKNEKSKKSI